MIRPKRKARSASDVLSGLFLLFLAAVFAGMHCSALADGLSFRCFGVVVDDNGRPISDVRVESYASPPAEDSTTPGLPLKNTSNTDVQGRFEFLSKDAPILLLARKPGLAPAWMIVTEPNEDGLRLVVRPGGSFSGVVLDHNKSPVADAEVFCAFAFDRLAAVGGRYWESFLSGTLARQCFSTRSEADGSFRIDSFPTNASAMLAARKSGLASLPTSSSSESWFAGGVSAQVGQDNLQVIVHPTGSIEGRVSEGGTDPIYNPRTGMIHRPGQSGRQIAQVQVILKPQSETWAQSLLTTLSAEDGSFRFPDVAAGHYLVRGIADKLPASRLAIVGSEYYLHSGEQVTNLNLRAVPGGNVTVQVRSKEDGSPIPGAAITLNREKYICNSAGVSAFKVPAGDCQFYIQKDGFEANGFHTNVAADKTTQVAFSLVSLPKITGSVVSPLGKPILGAQITAFIDLPNPSLKTRSKADGTFALPWNRNYDRQLTPRSGIIVRDLTNGNAAFVPFIAGNRDLTLHLAPGLKILGKVKDQQGKPLNNVRLTALFKNGGMPVRLDPQAMTDTRGHFEINALPRGFEYFISAFTEGHRGAQIQVAVSETNQIDLPPIVLEGASSDP